MNISEFIKIYLISVPTFFAIDLVWLTLVANKLYKSQLGPLLTDKINWQAAILFYFVYLIGVVFFVLIPAVEHKSVVTALVYGALFGFFAYATYDLTNLATIKNWPLMLTIVDLIWGTVLTASVSSVTYLIFQFLRK